MSGLPNVNRNIVVSHAWKEINKIQKITLGIINNSEGENCREGNPRFTCVGPMEARAGLCNHSGMCDFFSSFTSMTMGIKDWIIERKSEVTESGHWISTIDFFNLMNNLLYHYRLEIVLTLWFRVPWIMGLSLVVRSAWSTKPTLRISYQVSVQWSTAY